MIKSNHRVLWALGAVILVISMVVRPAAVYDGAITGLKMWWNIVFPSLLPFFITAELLLNFGVVKFLGVLLEPVMRPLFNVPGAGSFVLCVGFTSGYPIGAAVTARLRSQGLCTRVEAERLMCFTNNSSPLFMLVAVSVGMFGRPELGLIIAGSHYIANILLGLLLRFYGRRDLESIPSPPGPTGRRLRRAWAEMTWSLRQEQRTLGKITGDAVKRSIDSLLNIGGFIILFAVIIKILNNAGFINIFARCLEVLLTPLGLDPAIMPALASGFFEMTMGIKLASQSPAPLTQQVLAASIILAWSGLSVQAQVASMIAGTDIRMGMFFLSRIAHAFIATIICYLLLEPLGSLTEALAPVAALGPLGAPSLSPWLAGLHLAWVMFIVICTVTLSMFVIFIMARYCLWALKKIR